MQGIDGNLEQFKERCYTPNAVDTANKDKRAAGISKEEVVEVQILLNHQHARVKSAPRPAYLVCIQTFDDALSQRRHQSAFRTDIDDTRLFIPEIQTPNKVI